MNLNDFDFDLPAELIAQHPPVSREDSRLMLLNRERKTTEISAFPDIVQHFKKGDLLVINDTKVIPARLFGRKESGGKIEVFLVRRLHDEAETWACLTKSSKSPKPGTRLALDGGIQATVLDGGEEPYRRLRFVCNGDFLEMIEQTGRIPLPPYIRREETPLDRERYQTVFANMPGAVAAPTAGLHFTPRILDMLRSRGVDIRTLTLHVGLGTFLPVRTDDITAHRMHEETYIIPSETACAVNRAKEEGRRVFALGTTTTRTLEHAVDENGHVRAGGGASDLFIYPGFRFRIIDALITNFHLPKSTLLMLVSAFAGRDMIMSAYHKAVEERFRFFSYGDCMLIL